MLNTRPQLQGEALVHLADPKANTAWGCGPPGAALRERGARREAPGCARSAWPCSQFALGTVDLGYEEALLHRTAG